MQLQNDMFFSITLAIMSLPMVTEMGPKDKSDVAASGCHTLRHSELESFRNILKGQSDEGRAMRAVRVLQGSGYDHRPPWLWVGDHQWHRAGHKHWDLCEERQDSQE